MIVKVQLPIASNDPDAQALVYNRTRSVSMTIPITADLRKKMGEDNKRFFNAKLNINDEIVIEEKAPWQEW